MQIEGYSLQEIIFWHELISFLGMYLPFPPPYLHPSNQILYYTYAMSLSFL